MSELFIDWTDANLSDSRIREQRIIIHQLPAWLRFQTTPHILRVKSTASKYANFEEGELTRVNCINIMCDG